MGQWGQPGYHDKDCRPKLLSRSRSPCHDRCHGRNWPRDCQPLSLMTAVLMTPPGKTTSIWIVRFANLAKLVSTLKCQLLGVSWIALPLTKSSPVAQFLTCTKGGVLTGPPLQFT